MKEQKGAEAPFLSKQEHETGASPPSFPNKPSLTTAQRVRKRERKIGEPGPASQETRRRWCSATPVCTAVLQPSLTTHN